MPAPGRADDDVELRGHEPLVHRDALPGGNVDHDLRSAEQLPESRNASRERLDSRGRVLRKRAVTEGARGVALCVEIMGDGDEDAHGR